MRGASMTEIINFIKQVFNELFKNLLFSTSLKFSSFHPLQFYFKSTMSVKLLLNLQTNSRSYQSARPNLANRINFTLHVAHK